MRINLSIENASVELLTAILPFMSGATVQTTPPTTGLSGTTPDTVIADEVAEEAPVTQTQPEPTGAAAGDGVAALIAKLDSSFKRAKTVTLKGGAQGKEGDYVTTEAGEEGVIEAVYRGRAVVSFEDGTGDEYGSSTLTLVPADDNKPAEPEPAAAATEAPRRRRAAAEPEAPASSGDPEADEVYAKAAKLDPGALTAILKEFDMSDIKEFAELEGEDRSDFIAIIREEAAQ